MLSANLRNVSRECLKSVIIFNASYRFYAANTRQNSCNDSYGIS